MAKDDRELLQYKQALMDMLGDREYHLGLQGELKILVQDKSVTLFEHARRFIEAVDVIEGTPR